MFIGVIEFDCDMEMHPRCAPLVGAFDSSLPPAPCFPGGGCSLEPIYEVRLLLCCYRFLLVGWLGLVIGSKFANHLGCVFWLQGLNPSSRLSVLPLGLSLPWFSEVVPLALCVLLVEASMFGVSIAFESILLVSTSWMTIAWGFFNHVVTALCDKSVILSFFFLLIIIYLFIFLLPPWVLARYYYYYFSF